MQTLRRELRQAIMVVLESYGLARPPLADDLADAVLSISGIARRTDEEKPVYEVKRGSQEWKDKARKELIEQNPVLAILSGADVSQEDIDQNKLIQEALNAFESDLQLPGNWQWYASKPAEEKVWKALREFIVKKYVENPKAFAEYQTWRTQPFASGKMSNRAIKTAPQDFEASWSDFLASSSMYRKQNKSGMFETLT